MSPFDIVIPRFKEPEPEPEVRKTQRRGTKRGARAGAAEVVRKPTAPPPDGIAATPRTRDWRAGVYSPSTQMREAIERARAEQPALISLAKEAECDIESTLSARDAEEITR